MDWLNSPEAWMALATLTGLEIILGIDNIVFISILAGRLPPEQQARARLQGLVLAMGMRILLLFSLAWLMRLTEPLFHLLSHAVSGRDLIMLGGGLFLLGKATFEIHEKLEGEVHSAQRPVRAVSFARVLIQIMFMDIIFSLDSVITAIGMAEQLAVMVTAVVISVGFMMVFSGTVSRFIEQHPTLKMLALSFLLLIGVTLVADGLHFHIPKGYIYFSMAFSLFVEVLNLKLRTGSARPVRLHGSGVG